MANNYRIESQKFFNAQVGYNHRSWARSAAAYFRQVGSSNKANFVDAMAEYYAKINSGAVSPPISLLSTQAVVSNAGTSPVQNSAGAAIANGTYTVAANAVTNIKLPATVGAVSNAGTVTCTVTTVTSRTAGQADSKVVTFTVANGVITAISIP